MKIFQKKIAFFSFLFLIVLAVNMVSVYNSELVPIYLARPLVLATAMVMYVSLTKKPYKLFLLCQFFVMIADFFQYFGRSYFSLSLFFYIVGQLFLIKLLFSFLKKVPKEIFSLYMLLLLTFFFIIFFFVLDEKADKLSILFYGITVITLASLVIVNYLKRMSLSNLLFLIGIMLGVLSNAIMSINLTNILEDTPVLAIATFFAVTIHYFFCLGFIQRDKELSEMM